MNRKHFQELLPHIPASPMRAKTAIEIGGESWPRKSFELRARHAAAVLRKLHAEGYVQRMPHLGRTIYWWTARGLELRDRQLAREAGHGA